METATAAPAAPAPVAASSPSSTVSSTASSASPSGYSMPSESSAPSTATATPTLPNDWRASLPIEMRTEKTFEKFKDVGGLAQSYRDLETKLGGMKDMVPLPKTPEDYNNLWSKLGRPDKPDGYKFTPIQDADKIGYTAEQDTWFAEQAHKLGVLPGQAESLRQAFVQRQMSEAQARSQAEQARTAKQHEALQKIEREMGSQYPAALDSAKRLVSELGGQDFAKYLTDTGLGNDPQVVQFMLKVGQTLRDHSIIQGSPRFAQNFKPSPAQAQAELEKMRSDKDTVNILMNNSHPRHDALVARQNELIRAQFGG